MRKVMVSVLMLAALSTGKPQRSLLLLRRIQPEIVGRLQPVSNHCPEQFAEGYSEQSLQTSARVHSTEDVFLRLAVLEELQIHLGRLPLSLEPHPRMGQRSIFIWRSTTMVDWCEMSVQV